MTLLQQRTLLGLISEGDGSVDLGALLKRLNATLTGPTKTQASIALAAYSAAVVAYARDGELADVSARPDLRSAPRINSSAQADTASSSSCCCTSCRAPAWPSTSRQTSQR